MRERGMNRYVQMVETEEGGEVGSKGLGEGGGEEEENEVEGVGGG